MIKIIIKKMCGVIICVVICSIAAVANAEVSEWEHNDGAKIRLIATNDKQTGKMLAGIQINMKYGWKTYWKNPGEAGIPPALKLDKSENLKNIKVSLPTPQLFNDKSIGYKNNVVFLVEAEPVIRNKNSVVRVEGLIGVCEKICIPTEFDITLETNPNNEDQKVREIIRNAKTKLPKSPTDNQKIISAEYDNQTNKIIVQAVTPEDTKDVGLFVKNPDNWYMSHGKIIEKNRGNDSSEIQVFEIQIYDVPEDVDVSETEVEYTLVVNGDGTRQIIKTK